MRTCRSKSARSPKPPHPALSPTDIALRIACSPFSRIFDYAEYPWPKNPSSVTHAGHIGIIGESAFPMRTATAGHRTRPEQFPLLRLASGGGAGCGSLQHHADMRAAGCLAAF